MSESHALLDALRSGGKAALARALTEIEAAPCGAAMAPLLDAALAAPVGLAIGLTGPPGVGKSTLAGALAARMRARDQRVGILAVDPSSRQSGGAILGDRTRIAGDRADPGLFIRSMAARSRLGGLAAAAFPAVVLMRAIYERVIVESVGVGQSETDIADCVELVVLCVQPGAGDGLQFMKAGVMEVPDLVLVTKGDLGPSALRTSADLRAALSLTPGGAAVPVAVVSVAEGEGLDAALALIEAGRRGLAAGGVLAQRRRDQARAWSDSVLTDSFGFEGHRALDPRPRDPERPFGSLAALHCRVKTALHECLKTV